MTTVGLRELRQDASALVRRVEEGEEITVTVAGRPSARIVPAKPGPWRTWSEISGVFETPGDPRWGEDRELIDDGIVDPWAPR